MSTHRVGGIRRDVVITFLGRIALTAAILLGDVVIARTLGPEGKGSFTLVLAFTSLGALILSLGMDRSLGVLVGQSADVARNAFANAVVWTILVGTLGFVALLFLYGSSTHPGPIATFLPPLAGNELLYAALALPAEIAYGIGVLALLGRQKVFAFNIARFARRALLVPFVIGAAFLGHLDLTLLLELNLAVLGLTVGAMLWSLLRSGLGGGHTNLRMMAQQLSFGGRAFIGTMAERLQYRTDTFLLTAFVSIAATGVYSVAQNLAETMWYLPSSFGLVLFSRAVQHGAESSGVASAMTRVVLALGIVVAIPLWLVAPSLIEIVYGPAFAEASVAFRIMLPGVVAYSVVAVLSHWVIAHGAPGRAALVAIVGFAVNLAGNLVLIPQLGMDGAALVAAVSYGVSSVLMVALFVRLSGRSFPETLIIRGSDVRAQFAAVRRFMSRPERGAT